MGPRAPHGGHADQAVTIAGIFALTPDRVSPVRPLTAADRIR